MRNSGLVDLQVNGYAGVDFNDAGLTADAMQHALQTMQSHGVACCLPTVITAAPDDLAARLAALDQAVAGCALGAAMVPGYHLEGPFLNPADGYAGCHPPSVMTAPDIALVRRLEAGLRRPILLITLAPELPGAEAFIAWAHGAGKLVSIGHSAATREDVQAACDAGAGMSTHLGNGSARVLPRFDNAIFAQLAEDRLSAGFIADGIHVRPDVLQVMLRAKELSRCHLVTDAVAAAAAPPGRYSFAGMAIEHAIDGSVRVPGGTTLAGSALRLDQAVRNVVAWGLATPEQAMRMAGATPRALLAPALAAHAIVPVEFEVEWTADLHVAFVRMPHGLA
jgi:N-acetylglucosamine-6-phosphate deacetylase